MVTPPVALDWSGCRFEFYLSDKFNGESKNHRCTSKLVSKIREIWEQKELSQDFSRYCRSQLARIAKRWASCLTPEDHTKVTQLINCRRNFIDEQKRVDTYIKDIDTLFKTELFAFNLDPDGKAIVQTMEADDPERCYQFAEIFIERFFDKKPEMNKPEYQSNVYLAAFMLALKYNDDCAFWNKDFIENIPKMLLDRPCNLACFNRAFLIALEMSFLQVIEHNIAISPSELLKNRMKAIDHPEEPQMDLARIRQLSSLRDDLCSLALPHEALIAVSSYLTSTEKKLQSSGFATRQAKFLNHVLAVMRKSIQFKLVCLELCSSQKVSSDEQLERFVSNLQLPALLDDERVVLPGVFEEHGKNLPSALGQAADLLIRLEDPLCEEMSLGCRAYFYRILIAAVQETVPFPERRDEIIESFCLTCLQAMFETTRDRKAIIYPFLLTKDLTVKSARFKFTYMNTEGRQTCYLLEKKRECWYPLMCDGTAQGPGSRNIRESVAALLKNEKPGTLLGTSQPSEALVRAYVNAIIKGGFTPQAYFTANEELKQAYLKETRENKKS